MRKVLFGLFVLLPALLFAQAPLIPSDAPSFNQMTLPPIPRLDWEGHSIKAVFSTTLPSNDRMEDMVQNAAQILKTFPAENLPSHLYWHQGGLGPYCHLVDFQDDDWFGWQDDTKFQWVFADQGILWTQEPLDARWLCYAKASWWWKGNDGNGPLCLYREGSYYTCDDRGNITDHKGERPGELKGDYDGPFKGDSMTQQVFYLGSGGSRGGFHAGGPRPWAHRSPLGMVYTSQTVAWSGR
jgi:hypothetical protein